MQMRVLFNHPIFMHDVRCVEVMVALGEDLRIFVDQDSHAYYGYADGTIYIHRTKKYEKMEASDYFKNGFGLGLLPVVAKALATDALWQLKEETWGYHPRFGYEALLDCIGEILRATGVHYPDQDTYSLYVALARRSTQSRDIFIDKGAEFAFQRRKEYLRRIMEEFPDEPGLVYFAQTALEGGFAKVNIVR
jgi:hypothetical protein